MYSAVKVNGQKLYDLARQGREVERPARDIVVHEIELLDYDEDAQKGTLRLVVSKGTYVRTLVNDLGEKARHARGDAQPGPHARGRIYARPVLQL